MSGFEIPTAEAIAAAMATAETAAPITAANAFGSAAMMDALAAPAAGAAESFGAGLFGASKASETAGLLGEEQLASVPSLGGAPQEGMLWNSSTQNYLNPDYFIGETTRNPIFTGNGSFMEKVGQGFDTLKSNGMGMPRFPQMQNRPAAQQQAARMSPMKNREQPNNQTVQPYGNYGQVNNLTPEELMQRRMLMAQMMRGQYGAS
jgi:hypothetical protein